MDFYDLEDKVEIEIFNKMNQLYYSIESYRKFDDILNSLRLLYKKHPEYFTSEIVDKINSYKNSSMILRNKKPLPYIDYRNERVNNNFKYFNRVKRK